LPFSEKSERNFPVFSTLSPFPHLLERQERKGKQTKERGNESWGVDSPWRSPA
jgi:hypothetical protein